MALLTLQLENRHDVLGERRLVVSLCLGCQDLPRRGQRRQPVDHHVPHALFDHQRAVVVGGQGVPVGDEVHAVVVRLQLGPPAQRAHEVAEVQLAGRTHPGDDAWLHGCNHLMSMEYGGPMIR